MSSAPRYFSFIPIFPTLVQTPPNAPIPNTVSYPIPTPLHTGPPSNTASEPSSVASPVNSSAFSDHSNQQSVESENLSQQQLQVVSVPMSNESNNRSAVPSNHSPILHQSDPPTWSNNSSSESEHQSPSRPPNVHPMQTRSTSGFHNPRIHPSLFLTHCEPRGVKQAMADPNWLSAMQLEYNALINNHTWDLVPLPPNRKAVGCKWVFQVKENADGTINKYKARLVARGFIKYMALIFMKLFPLLLNLSQSEL